MLTNGNLNKGGFIVPILNVHKKYFADRKYFVDKKTFKPWCFQTLHFSESNFFSDTQKNFELKIFSKRKFIGLQKKFPKYSHTQNIFGPKISKDQKQICWSKPVLDPNIVLDPKSFFILNFLEIIFLMQDRPKVT